MSRNTWVECVTWNNTDGSALTGITATSLLTGTDAVFAFQPGVLKVNTMLRLKAWGRISNIVTSPGTFTFDFRLGGTVVFNGGAMALNAVAKTNVSWELEMMMKVVAVGSAATILGVGRWISESVIGSPLPSAGGSGALMLPSSAPAVGTSFDSRGALSPDLFGTWSVNNAGNTIQLHVATLEMMN